MDLCEVKGCTNIGVKQIKVIGFTFKTCTEHHSEAVLLGLEAGREIEALRSKWVMRMLKVTEE